MRFSRIKVTEKIVELDWSEVLPNGEKKSITLESPNRPMPALLQAMARFRTYVADLLELPTWADDMRVTTLNIDEGKDGRRGLIVTCIRPVAKASNRPLVLNTPQMRESNGDDDAPGFLADEILTLVKHAEVAAAAFVRGDREQTEMPLGAPATAAAAPAVDELGSRRRRKKNEFIPEVGALANPNATIAPPDDTALRSRLLGRGRDVPVEAIGRWISSERDSVLRWLDTAETIGLDDPEALTRDATMSIFDDAKGDDWTQDAPPPKAESVEAITAEG